MPHPSRPDPEQGVFETLLVLDRHPVELDAHLARLESSLVELFPDRDPPALDVPVERGPYGHLRTGTSGVLSDDGAPSSMRITVAPAGESRLEARTSARKIALDLVFDPAPVALHSLPVAGGLGAHKWADRSLLDEAQAELPEATVPLIVDADGAVLEASRANVFAVRNGAVFTPPLDGRILPGITRMRVLKIATSIGIDTREAKLPPEDLLAADEVFLTGSVRGIEPVGSLDGVALGGDGPVISELAAGLHRAWLGTPVG